MESWLEVWLVVVSLLSFFGSFQALFLTNSLRDNQFSLAPHQVTPLSRRLFGAWTLVTAMVRLQCALDIKNMALYRLTMATFVVAFGLYAHEYLIAKSIPFKKALYPFIVAGTSLAWMTWQA
ncbi:ergosterol biosynthesis protein [Balamuthia mandrillaris]